MKLISDVKLQDLINWHPIETQIPVIQSVTKNRETVLCAGRRFGKSALCAYLATRELLKDKKHIWIVSPTYNLSEKVFAYVKEFVSRGFPSLANGISTRPYPKVITPWGSWIECKSGDEPNSLLGEELDLLIVDEAARIKKDVYERYLFPTTSSRQGKIIFISTPFGKNWFHTRWVENNNKGASFQFSSLQGASIKEGEWEKAKSELPADVFEQEYLATFRDGAATVFRGVKNCVCECLAEPRIGHTYIMGLDLAKMNDFTVVTIIDRNTHEVVFHDRFQKIPYPLQRDRIRNAAIKYNRCKIVIDALNVGSAIGDDLRNDGIYVEDFKATGTVFIGDGDTRFKGTKERIIDKLSAAIEDKNIKIPPIPVLIDELEGFGYEMTDSGRMTYQAPTGGHDDCVMSLALANWKIEGKAKKEQIEINKSMPKKKRQFPYL